MKDAAGRLARKTKVSRRQLQFGALCYRLRNGKVQVLLTTSRKSGKWIIPKGGRVGRKTDAASARQEAWEEAGVKGRIAKEPIGHYHHSQKQDGKRGAILVAVFPLKVRRILDDYPEKNERKRKWFGRKSAARRVRSAELRQMIRQFDPANSPPQKR